MSELRWLVAENGSLLFAVPKTALREMVSGVRAIRLPFSGEFIHGVIIHEGRAIPVFVDESTGFVISSGDYAVLDLDGDLLALPVRRISGFCEGQADQTHEAGYGGIFKGTIACESGPAASIDIRHLYKKAGFI